MSTGDWKSQHDVNFPVFLLFFLSSPCDRDKWIGLVNNICAVEKTLSSWPGWYTSRTRATMDIWNQNCNWNLFANTCQQFCSCWSRLKTRSNRWPEPGKRNKVVVFRPDVWTFIFKFQKSSAKKQINLEFSFYRTQSILIHQDEKGPL